MLMPLVVMLSCATTQAVNNPLDTLHVTTVQTPPIMDGRIGAGEYGAPAAHISTAAGDVQIWMARYGGAFYIAAQIPDSSYYWGDDFVIGIDVDGSGGASPSTGDRQWYLRRDLDRSVVSTVTAAMTGRWSTPGSEPPMLGATHSGADWNAVSITNERGWSLELRINEASVRRGALPRIGFRTYNDAPQGWWSHPAPAQGIPAQRVERSPDLWLPIRFR